MAEFFGPISDEQWDALAKSQERQARFFKWFSLSSFFLLAGYSLLIYLEVTMTIAIFLVLIVLSVSMGWMIKEFQYMHAKLKVVEYLDNEVERARSTDDRFSQRLLDLEMKVTNIHSKFKDGTGITTRLSELETRIEGLNNKIAASQMKR